jgi:hypothetical protein
MTRVPLAFARRQPPGIRSQNSNANIRIFHADNNGFFYDRPARTAPKIKWEFRMIMRRLALVLCCLGLATVVHGLHAQAKLDAMAVTPSELKWGAQGSLAMPGMEQVNLVGDPSKPDPPDCRLEALPTSPPADRGKQANRRKCYDLG